MNMKEFEFENLNNNTLDNLIEGFQLIGFDWKYLYVNHATVKQSKLTSKEDLLGYTMMEKFPGIDKTEMFRLLKKCMKNRVSINFENEFTFPDGSIGWFELRMEPVPKGVFILSMDISDRKKFEKERKEYIKSLEDMLFMTSHEVRKPVASCLGLMEIIDNKNPTKEELFNIVKHIKESASQLDAFTKKLLKFITDLKIKNE